MIDAATFKEAMSRHACGVSLLTTLDEHGHPKGFTASSLVSVSATPPMLLACLSQTAESHAAFLHAPRFAVSLLSPSQEALAQRFAQRRDDKFDIEGFIVDRSGIKVVAGASAVLICASSEPVRRGDHTVFFGLVERVILGTDEQPALVHYRRRLQPLQTDMAERSAQMTAKAAGTRPSVSGQSRRSGRQAATASLDKTR